MINSLIAAAFMIWGWSFAGFFTGRIALSSDAVSYYDHTKFLVEQIARGQFPLWDPYWSGGVPNDFFLRRIGPYNPFLMIPVVLVKCGVKFFYAYMAFQAAYFFAGMTGFFLLARRVLGDEVSAFVAFLVLLFSVLGTRIFDSYMLLVTIPIIWFFYFAVSFFTRPGRASAAGMTLALVLLLTTYIPLYFFIILIFFLAVYIVCFTGTLPGMARAAVVFIAGNRLFAFLCAGLLFLAVLPGLSFFHQAGQGGIAIPGRHFNTTAQHVLTVEPQLLNPWSVMEEFFFASYYTDLTRIAFAIVYVPLFALIVLGVGILVPVSRLFMLLFLWAALIILFSMPIGFPLYDLFCAHLGFVKYFRNLHFLLWFILLPLFALFTGEVWRRLTFRPAAGPLWIPRVWTAAVHLFAFVLLLRQGDALPLSYAALAASAVVWALVLSGRDHCRRWILPALLAAVVVQPLAVFHYLSGNYAALESEYFYDRVDGKFSHQTAARGEGRVPSREDASAAPSFMPDKLYYTTDIYNALRARVNARDLERYEHYKFYLYDKPPVADDLRYAFEGTAVRDNSPQFHVIDFQMNRIILGILSDVPRDVVYNDANAPGWSLTVNGRAQPLFTANGAYKGFHVPAGSSTVILSYGSWGQYLLNWGLLGAVYAMFFYLIILYRREPHE
jgi:hypothetical protein